MTRAIAPCLLLTLAASHVFAAAPAHATEIFLVNTGAPLIYDTFTIEDARTAGMGRVTAIPRDGMVATWWNPAFLAFASDRSLSLNNAVLTEFESGSYIRSATVSGPLLGQGRRIGVGFGLKRLDFGDVDFFDLSGEPDEVSIWEQAYVAAIGYGLTRNVAVGIALEYVWMHFDPDPALNITGSAGAFSASLGVGYRQPIEFAATGEDADRLTVTPMAAATLQHVGEKLEFDGSGEFDGGEEDLYRQLRGAIGFDIEHSPASDTPVFDSARLRQFALATAIEAWTPAREWEEISLRRAVVHFGAELTLFGVLSGRIGFINDDLNNRVSWDNTHGIGIALPDGLPVKARFDWAVVPWGGSERIERRTLSISLADREAERE